MQSIRQYRINSETGRGNGGVVYHAYDTVSKRDVALKVCDSRFYDDVRIDQLKSESEIMAWLHVDAVPAFYELFHDTSYTCLVMDYVRGRNLETVFKEASDKPVTEAEAIEWGIRICDVLHALHTHSTPHLYRSLKPKNLILSDERQLFLIDYGKVEAYDPTKIYSQTGTPGYAPPEQYVGQPEPRSDIYSLGVLLYHAMTCYDPRAPNRAFLFHVKPPRIFNPQISAAFEEVILRAVEHKVRDRFASAAAFRAALVRCRKEVV
jgi:serine/threonine protein kinase